jgi:hypothetical protein
MGRENSDIETCIQQQENIKNKRQRMIHLHEHWHNILHERSLFISMMIFMNFYLILLYNSEVLSYEKFFKQIQ